MKVSSPLRTAAALAMAVSLASAALVSADQSGPDYLAVQSGDAGAVSQNTVRLWATTDGDIPLFPDSFVNDNIITGFAWADLGTGTALVATIHPYLGRDSLQRKDQWHLHTVQLTGGATAPNDFCLVAVTSTPTGGIRIQGNTITVDIAASKLPYPVGAFDAAVGFTVHGDDACGSGLGVRIRN